MGGREELIIIHKYNDITISHTVHPPRTPISSLVLKLLWNFGDALMTY
jgi:hypothetical protein